MPGLSSLKTDINAIIVWTIATPVLAAWMLLSILPLFSLFGPDQTALTIALDIAFLGTGFYAFLFGLIAARAMAANFEARESVMSAVRGAGLKLAAYGGLWLLAYWGYRAFVV